MEFHLENIRRERTLQEAKDFISKLTYMSLYFFNKKELKSYLKETRKHIFKLQVIRDQIPSVKFAEPFLEGIKKLEGVIRSIRWHLEDLTGDDPEIKITFANRKKM